MTALHKTHIYLFAAEDPKTVPQRLHLAVSDFCSACGMDIPPAEMLHITRTQAGKPYFPAWGQVQFSISHSGKYWSCAMANQAIGYDIQENERPRNETPDEMIKRHKKMALRFFHPLEAEFVLLDCKHNFLTVWTALEAYVKYTGQGIDRHFSEHCVIPDEKALWQGITGNKADIHWVAMEKNFYKTNYGSDYTMCVCTDEPCECTIISYIDEKS